MLTAKQEKFCQLYVKYGDQNRAYREAYPKAQAWQANSVTTESAKILTKPHIISRVTELRERAAVVNDISPARTIRELARIAFFDIRKILGSDGQILPPDKWDKDVAPAIQSYRVNADGSRIVQLAPKLAALDALAKHLGLFEKDNRQKGESAMSVAEAIAAAQREAERRDRDA